MADIRIPRIVLVFIALAACVWVISRDVTSSAQGRQGRTRWEYARLYIGDGKAVFYEARRKSTVNPPLNPLSGNESRGERIGERYSLVSKAVRNDETGALNYFGSQGWEAVAVTPAGKGFMVLMKRPY